MAMSMAMGVFMFLEGTRHFTEALRERVESTDTTYGSWYEVSYAVGFLAHYCA